MKVTIDTDTGTVTFGRKLTEREHYETGYAVAKALGHSLGDGFAYGFMRRWSTRGIVVRYFEEGNRWIPKGWKDEPPG